MVRCDKDSFRREEDESRHRFQIPPQSGNPAESRHSKMNPTQQHHFNWLNFFILSGAIAVNTVGAAEIAQPGTNPFVNPVVDVGLFNNILAALKASQE